MGSIGDVREAGAAVKGVATIMAIATANPDHFVLQSDFTDFYFNNTSGCKTDELKDKLRRICERTKIRKRHMYVCEEMVKKYPSLGTYNGASYSDRQDILAEVLPEQAVVAAKKAIAEWGRPVSDITHYIFCTAAGGDMPGIDFDVAIRLGLNTGIQRIPLYHQGCYAGGTMLRVAKDVAENNPGARILCVASESTLIAYRGQDETHVDNLVCQALFGDGACALIVGASPSGDERPIFEIAAARQAYSPNTVEGILGVSREDGLMLYLQREIPSIVSGCIDKCLRDCFAKLGVGSPDYNDMFWAVHPGGPAILNQIESTLGLSEEKLSSSRMVLSEYGNLAGACVMFVLNDIRRKSKEGKLRTTGEGHDMGFLISLGSGLTVEVVVLRAMPVA